MRYFLVGLPSSGKTTLGEQLANHLGMDFIDMDKLIERDHQTTIPEIFNTRGEDHFRAIETETIASFELHDNIVVSTGGGAPCFNDNMNAMKGQSLVRL